MMEAILRETFEVLELDAFYVALVPLTRAEFIKQVIFEAKGSVASYASHFPSSHQHYKHKKMVDTRALNGFVVRKARESNVQAPINECAPLLATAAIAKFVLCFCCLCTPEMPTIQISQCISYLQRSRLGGAGRGGAASIVE
jgi:hypothetical protein